MGKTKGISVQVPADLHARVAAERAELDCTMNQYIQQVLEEHFDPKVKERGGNDMNGNTRTLAFQVSEELFQRVKSYLSKHGNLKQKDFIIGLIIAELERDDVAEKLAALKQDAHNGICDEEEGGECDQHPEGGDEEDEGTVTADEDDESSAAADDEEQGVEDGAEDA